MLFCNLNFSADWKEFVITYDGTKKQVKWVYLEKLNEIQEREGSYLANKLTSDHIQWHMHKMNVKLAAQTFSSSVADAIEFLFYDLKQPGFKGCEGTVKFIRAIDMAFDILNSRTPKASGFKRPLQRMNFSMNEKSLVSTTNMLLGATSSKGMKIILTKRKTGFICFATSIKSILSVAKGLLFRPVHPLAYVLTYRFSQDHLEVFFSCIRARNGWNNNPNSMQFRSSLQSMLFHNSVKGALKANCMQYEQVAQTPIFTLKWSKRASPLEDFDSRNENSIENPFGTEEIHSLSRFQFNVLYYISGFICRRMQSMITCSKCMLAIINDKPSSLDDNRFQSILPESTFTERKDRGGLIFPSQGILEIIKHSEKIFASEILGKHKKINMEQGICQKMVSMCIQQLYDKISRLFPRLEKPCLESDDPAFIDSHALQIVKKVAEKYLTMRLQTYAKYFNRVIVNKSMASVRQKLTKTIIFKNQ